MFFSVRPRRFPQVTRSGFLIAVAFTAIQLTAFAQNDRRIPVKGYITASHLPAGFDVNDLHVTLRPSTEYGLIGKVESSTQSPLQNVLQVGVYVEVTGTFDKRTRATPAEKVYLRDDWDQKLSGLGVIDKVFSNGPEPIVRADGYRIRITATTQVSFASDLKSLDDIAPNMWLHYEGKGDKTGTLVATRITLLPARPTHFKAVPGLEINRRDVEPAKDAQTTLPASNTPDPNATADLETKPNDLSTILDKDGNLTANARIRIGTFGGWHTIPADTALQQRVRRIGASVIPAFQNALPVHHPSRIPFRFFAVDDNKIRSEICYLDGLILVPRQVIDRLQNDDQLAAILADGIAYNLQRQAARTVEDNRLYLGTQLAADLATLVVPGVGIATIIGSHAVASKIATAREQERDRISLNLLSDAGYDPRQAPEAWRRLASKHSPTEPKYLPYPDRSGYQLSILNLQFRNTPGAAESSTSAAQ